MHPQVRQVFLNDFCHFINTNMTEFCDQMPFQMSTKLGNSTNIFNRTPSLGDRTPRLNSDSPAHDKENVTQKTPSRNFKERRSILYIPN